MDEVDSSTNYEDDIDFNTIGDDEFESLDSGWYWDNGFESSSIIAEELLEDSIEDTFGCDSLSTTSINPSLPEFPPLHPYTEDPIFSYNYHGECERSQSDYELVAPSLITPSSCCSNSSSSIEIIELPSDAPFDRDVCFTNDGDRDLLTSAAIDKCAKSFNSKYSESSSEQKFSEINILSSRKCGCSNLGYGDVGFDRHSSPPPVYSTGATSPPVTGDGQDLPSFRQSTFETGFHRPPPGNQLPPDEPEYILIPFRIFIVFVVFGAFLLGLLIGLIPRSSYPANGKYLDALLQPGFFRCLHQNSQVDFILKNNRQMAASVHPSLSETVEDLVRENAELHEKMKSLQVQLAEDLTFAYSIIEELKEDTARLNSDVEDLLQMN